MKPGKKRMSFFALPLVFLLFHAEAEDLTVVSTDRDGIWVLPVGSDGRIDPGDFVFIGAEVEPWHIRAADLTGDGLKDLVVACRYGPYVAVLTNTGSSFSQPALYEAGPKPYHTAAGDFDNDGDCDIAVTNPVNGGVLVILKNTGDGTFEKGPEFWLGNSVYGVEAGDFDLNGEIDLAVAVHGEDQVVLLLGNGGRLEEKARLSSEGGPKDVVLGNFNGDHLPDLAVVNYEGANVKVFINDSGGEFETSGSYSVGVLPRHLRADDLDGDGLDDLVVAGGKGSNEVYVLHCLGERFDQAVPYHTGPRPNGVWTYDLNGDGYSEIVAANWSLGNEALASLTVLRSEEGKTFSWLQDFKPEGGFSKLTFVVVDSFFSPVFIRGDINGDGVLNIYDKILGLRVLFGLKSISCLDSLDVNDDGILNIADPIYILAYLFADGPSPPEPFPEPGVDPTPDSIACSAEKG